MSETWVGCPVCGLKHRMRAEGTCPRCQSAVVPGAAGGAAALAMPALSAAVDSSVTEEAASEDAVGGVKTLHWAGLVLLANAGMAFLHVGVLRYYVLIEAQAVSGALPGVVIDALLGFSLLMGQEKFRQLALVRSFLGGVFVTLLCLFQGDFFTAVLQVLFSATLVTLLREGSPPGRARLAVGGALVLFALQGLSLYLMVQQGHSAFSAERNSRVFQRYLPGR